MEEIAMNIFVLDYDIQKCVEATVNRHVVKMVLETSQLLCTTLNLLGVETPYKSCHMKHPCRLWTGVSQSNFVWLCEYGNALANEYTYRYGKVHASLEVIKFCQKHVNVLPDGDLTPFAQAMPEQYKDSDAVVAYRKYYLGEKRDLFSWTKREIPEWVF